MLTVLHQTAPGVLRTDSITSEKIAVALFREVFSCEESFPPETYEQLSWVYRIYETFKIRCGGKERLLQAFEDGTTIRNVETFIWFSKQSDIYHQVFQGFDVMDSKWDPLAKALEAKQYLSLFDFCLREELSSEQIRQRLERYQALTGETYTDIFWKTSYGTFQTGTDCLLGLLQQPPYQGKAEGLAARFTQTASPVGRLNNFCLDFLSNFWGSLH